MQSPSSRNKNLLRRAFKCSYNSGRPYFRRTVNAALLRTEGQTGTKTIGFQWTRSQRKGEKFARGQMCSLVCKVGEGGGRGLGEGEGRWVWF